MREVIVSKLASVKVEEIADYIAAKFSNKDRDKFLEKFAKCVLLIQQNPELFPKSENYKTRYKCVVSKFTTIYYQFDKKRVKISLVFDSRQNLKKINKNN